MSARSITKRLEGRWAGSYGVARCPGHDDRAPSLLIKDAPDRRDSLFVHCFAGCAWRDVKAELERRGFLDGNERRAPRLARQSPASSRAPASQLSSAALAIWRSAQPAAGTAVEAYLRRRGITVAIPRSIRHHAALLPDRKVRCTATIRRSGACTAATIASRR